MNKIYEEILEPVLLPPMYDITQNFDNSHIDDLDEKINSSIRQIPNIECIKGKTIAIAVGSRGINRINEIVGCVIESLKRLNPKKLFIVPAMGSHGGAIADNQTKIL